MQVLPRNRADCSEWPYLAWGESHGEGVTVPKATLDGLLNGYLVAIAALDGDARSGIVESRRAIAALPRATSLTWEGVTGNVVTVPKAQLHGLYDAYVDAMTTIEELVRATLRELAIESASTS